MDALLEKTLSGEIIRYSQVWEDQELLREALSVGRGDQVLSIASAGCNALALSLQQPKRVVALDISSAQLALTELKLKGIELLSHNEFLGLMGFLPYKSQYFEKVEPALSEAARFYWRGHSSCLEEGLIHCGRLDQFFTRWAREHLNQFLDSTVLKAFLHNDSRAETSVLNAIKSADFELDFKKYYSEENIAAKGRDPTQFKYVAKQALEEGLLQRFRELMCSARRQNNHYLQYILTGQYTSPQCLPLYAEESVFSTLKKRVSRIELVCDSLEAYLDRLPDASFNCANLSNVFEYMSESETDALLALLAKKIKPGGRIAYWNLFCPRRSSANLSNVWQHETEMSHRLHLNDSNWFYTAFHVETRRT